MKGALAAKIPYKAAVQVATNADAILWRTQQTLNDCVLGGTKGERTEAITNELAYQSRKEGGLGHIHLMSRMKAEWASLVGTLHDNREPWRILWWERLKEIYGPLAEPDLERSTCAFKKCVDMGDASELQRRAMEAWGSLPGGKAVLLPPGGGQVFGISGIFKNNNEATNAARAAVDDAWRAGNPVPTASDAEGTPPECFWAGTLDGVHIVVLPLGLLNTSITPLRSCIQRARFTLTPAWCLLDAVSMEAEYEAVAVAFLRVDSFQRPAEHRNRLRVGSELQGSYTVPVAQHMATADACGTPIPFDVRVRDAATAAGTLRDALVQSADAESDTHLSACLHKWADRVSAPDIELVPEELRQHAVSFDVQALAARPFVHRCPIPSTEPLPVPHMQPRVKDFDPQVLSDVLFGWAIKNIPNHFVERSVRV